jgi:alpha-mannosidase
MTHTRFLIFFLAPLFALTADARGGDLEKILPTLPRDVRSGYAATLGGGTIYYHSVNPHARNALLARTTDGTQFVEWQTDAAPPRVSRSGLAFAWLAALSGSKGEHAFDLAVNGKSMFRFRTAPDSTRKSWTAGGPGGSKLIFCATEADRFGDLFGYMFLVLPTRSVTPGVPLNIRVTGEAAGSQAWFMVFEHRIRNAAWIRPIPALVRSGGGEMQPVSIDIEHYGVGGKAAITIEGGERLTGRLGWGLSSFLVRSGPATSPVERRVTVTSGDLVLADTLIQMLPVQRRTLYLLPHSHTDIGYSAYQAVVEKNHLRYLDDAMNIAERTAAYPEGARFKWNIEVMWPLESYISSSSPDKNERLARSVAAGRIGLNGLYSNVLTGEAEEI